MNQHQNKVITPTTHQKPSGFCAPRASSNAARDVDERLVCCCEGAKATALPIRRERMATVFMVVVVTALCLTKC
jgi:hypothetical protein